MNIRPILALLFAMSFSGVVTAEVVEKVNPTDPVAAITVKLNQKKQEIDVIEQSYDQAYSQYKTLQQEQLRLTQEGRDLVEKQSRAKVSLDKQYGLLLEDPETDLVSFKKDFRMLGVQSRQTKLKN